MSHAAWSACCQNSKRLLQYASVGLCSKLFSWSLVVKYFRYFNAVFYHLACCVRGNSPPHRGQCLALVPQSGPAPCFVPTFIAVRSLRCGLLLLRPPAEYCDERVSLSVCVYLSTVVSSKLRVRSSPKSSPSLCLPLVDLSAQSGGSVAHARPCSTVTRAGRGRCS